MAVDTDKSLRNMVMYQIFPRNFSREGNFASITGQLDRISSLGANIIWFTPIHPIGEKNRKGTLGSPYAIRDYRAVNPEFGTEEDFRKIVSEIHARGMKCIIDVVYNHTSPDSVLANEHPEWFWHTPEGNIGPRVADWSDVADLDYANRELWNYQIETLKKWAGIVDGFRCDVAPLVPLEFWKAAREAVKEVDPEAIWLCESVEPRFITYMRSRGMSALSDSELYQAFDISYDYDIFDDFEAYFKGTGTLAQYAASVNRQEYIYPDNYVKLRFLENHDRPRARSFIPDAAALRNATAFMFFQKGMALLYAGQEYGAAHLPTLFDKDDVDWDAPENVDLSQLISRLAQIKKMEIFANSSYCVKAISDDMLCAVHMKNERSGSEEDPDGEVNENGKATCKMLVGLFSFKGKPCTAELPKLNDSFILKDGNYKNILKDEKVKVSAGRVWFGGEPLIIAGDSYKQ